MCQCLQCWQVLFLPLFLIHIVCQCHLLCMVISFLVLWSICLSSSLIYFKKGSEYLTRGTAQVFIPLIRLLQDSFISSCFLVLLRYYYYCCCCSTYESFSSIVNGGLHWSPSDTKSPQFSNILLSILMNLNCAGVWTVSILPWIF